MKYFLIAGEASGDLHASNLVKGLKKEDPDATFTFIGGDLMTDAAGSKPLYHFRTMNFMGFIAVLANFFKIHRILRQTKHTIATDPPDVLILVDYAGFNLRMARYAHQLGLKVFYYISPKVWAWRESRLKFLKAYVDRLFVIFPFEVEFFRKHEMEVEYHGNPLIDVIHEYEPHSPSRNKFLEDNQLDGRPLVALLAGSRKQEIKSCLPEMIKAARSFPDYQFVVAGAPSVEKGLYAHYLAGTGIHLVLNQTYALLSHAEAAVVTSGTATLETALLNVPQVVIYKTGGLTYRIGKLFVTFRFFSLVNLILDRELVKEYLQKGLAGKITNELEKILNDKEHQFMITSGYEKIRNELGEPGVSDRVARGMIRKLRQKEK